MYEFLATVLPSLILVYFFCTQDRFPEPKKNIIITFTLGILITFPAGYINTKIIYFLYDNYRYESYYDFLYVLIPGATVEEILKLTIIILYCSRLKAFDEPMDGLVYGATAALGFAMYENFGYVKNALQYEMIWQEVAWIRGLLTAPMHACCGVILGFSISFYHFYNKKIIFILLGLIVSIFFHAVFNIMGGPLSEAVVIVQIIIVYLMLRNLKIKQKNYYDLINKLHD